MNLEFHPNAELELIEASLYYERKVPGLGARFENEMRRATDLLLENPEVGSPIEGQLRKFVLGTFPYNLIYSTSADSVWVLAVAHHKRKPGYWRDRL